MVWPGFPRGGIPVYISGNESKSVKVAPGQWEVLTFNGVRGIVSIAITNLSNPAAWNQTVGGSYICKIYSIFQPTSTEQPNPETDNNNVIAVWKDTLGVLPLFLRMPGGTTLVHIAVKNTTTSDTLLVVASVEI